jgi:hypothetical protein
VQWGKLGIVLSGGVVNNCSTSFLFYGSYSIKPFSVPMIKTMNTLKPITLLALSALLLAGCSSSNSGEVVNPDSEGNISIDLGEGDKEVVLEFPDFSSAGEEGEHSEEVWLEFAKIADDSKFILMENGGVEYFSTLAEPYAMIYDPESKAGDFWIAYYYPDTGISSFGYDLFEMTAYNAGLELYLYNSVGERPLTGSKVLKNPDGSYTVVVEDQDIKIRYLVIENLIAGVALFEGDTFMGYSEITYGLDTDTKALMSGIYDLAIENGETFEIPEDKRIISEEEYNQQLNNN